MKKIILSLMVLTATTLFANDSKYLGLWFTKNDKSIVKIYKDNSRYFGKIVWLKEPLKDNE